MRKLIFTFLIFCSIYLNAQDVLSVKELMKQYETKLELTENQKTKFNLILGKYLTELNKKGIDNKSFNKTNKLRDLEFYELLSKEQFNNYKKVKLEIEPSLKFRFN